MEPDSSNLRQKDSQIAMCTDSHVYRFTDKVEERLRRRNRLAYTYPEGYELVKDTG